MASPSTAAPGARSSPTRSRTSPTSTRATRRSCSPRVRRRATSRAGSSGWAGSRSRGSRSPRPASSTRTSASTSGTGRTRSSATATGCSARTSSTTAATRRWAARGTTSTSPRSAARSSGRTPRRATRRRRRISGGTCTTGTDPGTVGWTPRKGARRAVHHPGHRTQGAPSCDVGVGRLPGDGSDVPAAPRAAARRGLRDRPGDARPRRGRRHRQRVDPGRADRGGRHRQRPDPRAARRRPRPRLRRGPRHSWVEADAEHLPFEDASFDVVMSSIGAMFAPHHQAVADELVRVCRPGGTVGMLNWTPEGMIGALFRVMGGFAPPPPPGASPPPTWGSEDHMRELFGDRVEWQSMDREMLDITAFKQAADYGEHFKERYGPTLVARANAEANGRTDELNQAIDDFCNEWNRGGPDDDARFEQEYLVAVGRRAA